MVLMARGGRPDTDGDGECGVPRRRRRRCVLTMSDKRSLKGGVCMEGESRTMTITDLKARVARAEYDVDADAVARAFVARMLAVHGALRRADVCALLGDQALEEIRLSA